MVLEYSRMVKFYSQFPRKECVYMTLPYSLKKRAAEMRSILMDTYREHTFHLRIGYNLTATLLL